MALTYGFFNSLNHDRQYNTEQISSIFDGIVNDGVYASIGTSLVVEAASGMTVNVGIGRAWFNRTWTYNDAILPLLVPQSEVVLNRIDVVVLEVNSHDDVRANDIKIVKGAPATNPSAPVMIQTEFVHQYPLAHIYVGAGVTAITQANITNKVGTVDCPFVTGLLQVLSIDAIVAQWETQFTEWNDVSKAEFEDWLAYIQTLFGADPAGALQNQVDDINSEINTINGNIDVLTTRANTLDIETAGLNTTLHGLKQNAPILTEGTASALVVNGDEPLDDGLTLRLKLHVAITQGATINYNASGAKALVNSKGSAVDAGPNAGSYITVIYNGTSFILQGEGGDSGAAKKYHSDVFVGLRGLTFAQRRSVT